MVCVPCIFIPVLLFIWHKFIQPYVLKFWNPWAVKDDKGNAVETKFPFSCSGDSCPFPSKKPVEDANDNKTKEQESNELKPKAE